jgi:hypothetical protein
MFIAGKLGKNFRRKPKMPAIWEKEQADFQEKGKSLMGLTELLRRAVNFAGARAAWTTCG